MGIDQTIWKNWVILVVLGGFVFSIPIPLFVEQIDTGTFFGLYIPALLGVLGSYGLYYQRQQDEIHSLREALRGEIAGMYLLQNWPPEGSKTIPTIDVITMNIYESKATEMGLLPEQERKAIVDFYSRAKHLQEALKFHGELTLTYKTSLFGQDTEEIDREKVIMTLIDGLAIRRHFTLYLLDKSTNNDYYQPLVQGDTLMEDNPVIRRGSGILERYDLLEEVGETTQKYVVTEKGESLFGGDLDVSDMEPIEHEIGGLDDFLQNRLPRKIRSTLSELKQSFVQRIKEIIGDE